MMDEISFLPEAGLGFTNDAPLLINQNTIGGVLPLETTATNADLLATRFDVLTDHLLVGVTEVEFTVFNQGSEVATDFSVAVVYSEDEIIRHLQEWLRHSWSRFEMSPMRSPTAAW